MKAICFALVVVLLAVASAQSVTQQDVTALQTAPAYKSYINSVEYVDNLDTPPNPSLVPHYFIEAAKPRGKHAAKKANKKGHGKKGKAAKKGAKKAKRALKKQQRKMKKLAKLAKKGNKKALKKLKKATKKAAKNLKKLSGKQRKIAAMKLKKAKLAAKRALKKGKKAGKKGKKLNKKLAKKNKKAQKKLDKRAKKTDHKVRRAMDKLRHLSVSMRSLHSLMSNIHKQVDGLIPENRIRRYRMEDVSKISNSRMGSLKQKESKLHNPFKPNANKGASYSNKVIPKRLKVISKADDMHVQDMSAKAKDLSKFTRKLADKDDISLV